MPHLRGCGCPMSENPRCRVLAHRSARNDVGDERDPGIPGVRSSETAETLRACPRSGLSQHDQGRPRWTRRHACSGAGVRARTCLTARRRQRQVHGTGSPDGVLVCGRSCIEWRIGSGARSWSRLRRLAGRSTAWAGGFLLSEEALLMKFPRSHGMSCARSAVAVGVAAALVFAA
jgi:hypothetical protein